MLRSVFIIFLVGALLAQTFSSWAIQLDYLANRAKFEKNCENKSRPQMKCHGKCQMMKQLKEQEKKDQQTPERKLNQQNEVISSRSFFAIYATCIISLKKDKAEYNILDLPLWQPADIFHPPSV